MIESKDEIEGGIRNALERGGSLTEIAWSFVNSGYDIQEVKEIISKFGEVQLNFVQQKNNLVQNIPVASQQTMHMQQNIQFQSPVMQQPISHMINRDAPMQQNMPSQQNMLQQKNMPQQRQIMQHPVMQQPINNANVLINEYKKLPFATEVPVQEFPRWLVVFMILFSAFVLIASAVFGLYWDKWFN